MKTGELRFALSAAVLCVVGVAACSSAHEPRPSAESNAGSKQAATAITPLYFTQYQDLSNRTFVTAEVDDSGNTFALAYAGSTTGGPYFVYQFDANGAFVQRFTSAQGTGNEQHKLRVNDTGFALGGYLMTGIGTNHNAQQMTVDRFDRNGTQTFHYLAPVGAGHSVTGSVDICGDGSVVAAGYGGGEATVLGFDSAGDVQFSQSFANVTPTKVRCLGDGSIIVAGATVSAPSSSPFVAQVGADGTIDWTWTASDIGAQDVSFDVDGDGNVFVGATLYTATVAIAAYAVDTTGALQWSWKSDGANDHFAGIYAGDYVTLTGARGPSGSQHYYTAQLDLGGDLLWTRDDPFEVGVNAYATGVSMDDVDNTFVCGVVGSDTGATLYGLDGSTTWQYDMESMSAAYADVTNGVARCIGPTHAHGIGILAFPVR